MQCNLLELFSGTGSVGDVARSRGMHVTSIEILEGIDILTWDMYAHPLPVDFIWASPPCTSFTNLSFPHHHRRADTGEALSDTGRMGDRLLARTWEVIHFFMAKNPKLLYCIENPLGMMRKMASMKEAPFCACTSYCQYGTEYRKHTNLWSNFELHLKPACRPSAPCRPGLVRHTRSVDTVHYLLRIRIPRSLVEHILYLGIKARLLLTASG